MYTIYPPSMSQAEIDAYERDESRFYPDPDAGRHHPECCCMRCEPGDDYAEMFAALPASERIAIRWNNARARVANRAYLLASRAHMLDSGCIDEPPF